MGTEKSGRGAGGRGAPGSRQGRVIGGMGEDRLVGELLRALGQTPAEGLLAGPGDDCALAESKAGRLLMKVDAVVEGVHFLAEHGARRIGWKALARPLSDFAAAGGVPRWALVCAALPGTTPLRFIRGVYAGIGGLARRFGVAVAGGETVRSPGGIHLSVTVVGEACHRVPGRGGAAEGDEIWVTGVLGGSFASGHHLRFVPRLAEGRWLAGTGWVTAMMDVSDGLAKDLRRLSLASGVGFEVWEDELPRRRGCGVREALEDGEDYELVFTVPGRFGGRLVEAWGRQFPHVRLSKIGRIVKGAGGFAGGGGFDHFGGEGG